MNTNPKGKRFTISDELNSRNDKPFDWPLFLLNNQQKAITVKSRNRTHRFHNAVLDCVALGLSGQQVRTNRLLCDSSAHTALSTATHNQNKNQHPMRLEQGVNVRPKGALISLT